MSRVTVRLLWRLGAWVALMAISSACGGSGCQGCTPQPIPGGFPSAYRFDSAMQIRLSSSGVAFIENNFSSLVSMLVPGGTSFTIPPTDCSSTDQKICCSGPVCTATMSIGEVHLTPTPQSTVKLDMRAGVKTTTIKYEKSVPVLGWFTCDVTYDSQKADPPTLGLAADINLAVGNDDKLQIGRGSTTLEDFDCGDINISGSWYCTVVDWLCPLFKSMIQDQLVSTVDQTLDGMLTSMPLGQENRLELSSLLASYSPRTSGQLDYLLWAGSYSEAENAGMSLGAVGGFRPAAYSPCVPNCESSGASCTAPTLPTIARSSSFRGNQRPDGKTFDVGIGIDAQTLDMAAYGMYASGGLCLDVSSESVAQLSSATFSLLVPSISALTGSKTLPMMISVRPRQPPTLTLGKGTYHQDSSGDIVIDDPLLNIHATDFAIDIYLQLDERMVRLFTVVGQLEVPVLLYADAAGRLQPMLGALDQAFTDVKVENGELITENPQDLAQAFPTLLAVAAGFLSSGFSPIDLPSVQSLKLILDGGSITSVDANQVLAIFANLGLISTTSLHPTPQSAVEPLRASITREDLWVPPVAAFRLGPGFRPEQGPRLTVRLGAEGAPAGQPLEWAYRVDGGFFRPWVSRERQVIRDARFWLQGEHRVEVMVRVKDRPETTSAPAELSFGIGALAETSPVAARAATTGAALTEAEQGGCSVAGHGGAAGGIALLALALLLARRRR